MAFYAYILRCSEGSYYTGHTEALELRLTQHDRGTFADCYTFTRRPLALVWSQHFTSRLEALEAERRIKGWSRAKKEALIAGDWDGVSVLARNWQGGDGPSTSLGQTEVGRHYDLIPHPDLPHPAIDLSVKVRQEAGIVELHYRISGDLSSLSLPPVERPEQSDRLWEHTCFEAFFKPVGGESYREINVAPSRRWAMYSFDSYRAGMKVDIPSAPRISTLSVESGYGLSVVQALPVFGAYRLALSAVIEEIEGTKSYWALAHPPGAPDFHHPSGFVLELGAR